MGNVKSYKPWAVFFKPVPTEQDLLLADLKKLVAKEKELKQQQEQLNMDIAYVQHKLAFFENQHCDKLVAKLAQERQRA